ncbi:MAG: hypothetical protein M3203_03035 [Actinomycetota bacterium]|nr:hypothetical protein [Actinomycetota bacterium]
MSVVAQRNSPGQDVAPRAPDRAPRRVKKRLRRWETTPEKLRLVQVLLVCACVLSGVAAAAGLQLRVDAAEEIERRTEPLSADAVDVYRALANADATVAGEFLSSNFTARPGEGYDRDIEEAARGLARAATLTGRDSLTADRIADIAAQLPGYTALVESARAARGTPEGSASLRSASSLMQSTILRRAETFQRIESERLDAQYRRAGAVPTIALAAGGVSVLALLATQLMMARRTRRILSVGLLAATVAVLALAVWWTVALSASGDHLADSRRRSQAVSDALGPAQIAARQARASEILALVAREPGLYEPDFSARMQRLARQDGTGGALGAAGRLASDETGRRIVAEAVDKSRAWLAAHGQIVQLQRAGRHLEAGTLAIGPAAPAAVAFTAIDDRLAAGVAHEREAFANDVVQAQDALFGLVPGTVLVMVAAAAAAATGVGQRLKEYR